MTRRQDLQHHRHSLGEIREIMNSMKTLAYMETRKLNRFLDAQHAVVESIDAVAADFLGFHAETLPEAEQTTDIYLLIGTERGFCGDFNQSLLQHLESCLAPRSGGDPVLLAVGHKLYSLLQEDTRVTARINGASVVEEVTAVLVQLVHELSSLQKQHGMLSVYVIYHGAEDGVIMQKLLPPFEHYRHQAASFSHPPLLNLSPQAFFIELTEQYLFAALHAILYASLMAENLQRVTHLEGAVNHLDEQAEDLERRCNALRQEEIIEEIEVILLNSSEGPLT